MKIRNSAFTLAEVLITLAIIGVVAAITIPALMNNVQDAQYKTAYKKAFSVANQAWQQCLTNNELVERTDWKDNDAGNKNFLAFKKKFKVISDCTQSNTFKCWVNADQYYNTPINGAFAFIDNSGMAWSRPANEFNAYGDVLLVDTNGNKGPNQFGKDRFPLIPAVNSSSIFDSGLPIKLVSISDHTSIDSNYCPYGGCYYKSWLTQ